MSKAFTLLELIIAVLLISIILSFAITKYDNIFKSSNMTKVKSDLALIQNGISNIKRKNVLLSSNEKINTLDDAIALRDNEHLFSKVIDFPIVSTSSSQAGKWLKKTSDKYEFFLDANTKIKFILKDEFFECKSPKEICQELQ